jgi:hypothetical protein
MGTALSSAHTRVLRARFNPGYLLLPDAQFETLSFADDPDVASREIEAIFQSLASGVRVANPAKRWTLTMAIHVILHEVVDLTEVASTQAPLGTNPQELTGDWMGYELRAHSTMIPVPRGVAPTQELGFALFRTGIEGFRSISAKAPTNKTLTIFPQNLGPRSSITLTDSSKAFHL